MKLELQIGVLSLRCDLWTSLVACFYFLTLPIQLSSRSGQVTLLKWNTVALQGVSDSKLGAPIASRAVAIMHTCMYDAWAAYDEKAVGTELGGALRRPASERTEANKEKAVSYAAYWALTDLFPGDTEAVYKPLMRQLGYDP